MSVPSVADDSISDSTSSARRGWPRTAWCVIGLAVVGIAFRQSLREPNEDNSRGSQRDGIRTALLRFTGKLAVGGYNLSGRTDSRYYQLISPTNVGSAEGRFCTVILTGELKGPSEARKRLTDLLRDWAADESNVTDDDREMWVILKLLYDDYCRNELGAPSVHAADRAKLRKEFEWFGDLALSPPGADDDYRHFVLSSAYESFWTLICVGATFVVLLPIGFFGIIVFLVLALTRNLEGGLQRGSPHGGIYAETFALWIIVFVAINIAAMRIEAGDFKLLVIGLGDFLSLVTLGWPVLRGIPWQQVRKDIGWIGGRAGMAEPFVGVWSYVMGIPLMVAGVLIVLALTALVQRYRNGHGPAQPTHPVTDLVDVHARWFWLQFFFVLSISAPVIEETMFRGILYRQLRQVTSRWGFVPSLILSMLVISFVFAVIHPQGLLAVPVLMAIAFGLNLTREWRVSLLPSMVHHGVHNGCLVGLLYLIYAS